MAKGLSGRQVILAASRKTEEMEELIRRQGGEPLNYPLQGTSFLNEEQLRAPMRAYLEQPVDWSIFMTGMGLNAMLDIAEEEGIREAFVQKIQQTKVAARGYKTANVLKSLECEIAARDDDGTTEGMIRALEGHDFRQKRVMVQLHGIENPRLRRYLEEHGAKVYDILPYQHTPPEEAVAAECLETILNAGSDAICFTTAIQVHALFQYAGKDGRTEELQEALRHQVMPTAVGKVTAEALRERGIGDYVVPDNERMGAMIVALSKHFEQRKD
ncbi:uroporphyrinogen-III synthase [uncultured Marinococcus sp.]|uniref:uroporphyrinogen-III synthase n=1 Tax=uncultured Marinococcus sp. TaxID=487012 RepID=UPI002614B47F|nr:uroporphyrinogen-III synthase [uncultured Marinococcus sp.]